MAFKSNHLGEYRGERKTYVASFQLVAAAAANAFVTLAPNGASRVIRIDRIRINNATLTAAQILRIALRRYSSLPTGGTSTNPTPAQMRDNGVTSSALLQAFTVQPAGGLATPLTIQEYSLNGLVTGATAVSNEIFDDFEGNMNEEPTASGATQCLGLAFIAAPATAVTITVNITWTEDNS